MSISPARRSSSTIWNILKIILALLLVGFVFSRTNLDQMRSLLGHISLLWLACYIVLFLSLTLLKALQYYYLIGEGIPFTSVLNVVVLQNVITNYFAATAGIASYLSVFRMEHGVKAGRSMVVFLLTKVGDLIVIWVALCISSVSVWQSVKALHGFILVLTAGVGAALAIFFLTVFLRQRFVHLLGTVVKIVGVSRFLIVQKGMNTLNALSETETGVVVRMLAKAAALSAIYFLTTMAWIYSSLRMLDFQQSLRSIGFISTVMQLISYIPIQIFGGLGVSEAGSFYFWGLFQVSQVELASVLIGNRVIFYLVNLLPLLYLPIYTVFLRPKDESAQ